VGGDSLEDAEERACFDRVMKRNDFVVFAVALGGHAMCDPYCRVAS
jgi:hypothetical protein